MHALIETFSQQLRDAVALGELVRLNPPTIPIQNVVIAGVGGSGIGGSIVSEIAAEVAKIPITVSKGYSLPNYVNEKTLVIVSSYSGNTEETLASFREALTLGAQIVCITSGGELADEAMRNGVACIRIPAGMPPRACLGYSLVQILFILSGYGVIQDSFKSNLASACNLLDTEETNIQKEAHAVAEKLFGKICVIYTPIGSEGIAMRFKQQLNENTKAHAWHAVIPEMNHNEIAGWMEKNDSLAVVFFRNETDNTRIKKRIEVCKEIISEHASSVTEIWSKGNSTLERALYHIHFGDWISEFLPEMAGIDPSVVKNIDYLKEKMEDN